jgi:hypothetical protein
LRIALAGDTIPTSAQPGVMHGNHSAKDSQEGAEARQVSSKSGG